MIKDKLCNLKVHQTETWIQDRDIFNAGLYRHQGHWEK